MKKIKIVVICGPTASGKSRLAVDIARTHGGEVINADSMQVYRGMDIANATPSETERMGVAHHLFGIIDPSVTFSVAQWLELARNKISEVSERGALPVIVGGTGLYISSLTENITFDNVGADSDFRKEMFTLAEEHGNAFLLEKLREVDPEAASRLHENNVKRVIRALETYRQSGKLSGERLQLSKKNCSPYDICMFGLDFMNRQTLYERINERVNTMISNGLLEEARQSVHDFGNTSSQAIGHKEFLPFFRGEAELEMCIDNLKRKTRNYAKRQLTWFRKNEHINWLFMNDVSDYVHILQKTSYILERNT